MGDAPPEQRALSAGTARFVVLTGLSGAGKSQAINALEDLGYFCVDNLPTSLLPTLARFAESDGARVTPTAVVVDMRDPAFLDEFPRALASLRRRQSLGTLLIFLEADDNALVQRFSETRRPHPLARLDGCLPVLPSGRDGRTSGSGADWTFSSVGAWQEFFSKKWIGSIIMLSYRFAPL